MTSSVISCRWDWCRSSFPSIDALDAHVKREHIWPMKPMRKAEIALMRRMDFQSLHSSPSTDSGIISRGQISTKAPLLVPSPSTPQTRNEGFDTFTQLSSPSQTHSPERLPASPALEGLIRQDACIGLSAAVEMFERTHGLRTIQRPHLPSSQRSSAHRPLSPSSGSSQDVVEQQLTQEDNVLSQPSPSPEPPAENNLIDSELRWSTDDEFDLPAMEGMRDSGQPASQQNGHLGSSLDLVRGQRFRHGPFSVPLSVNVPGASLPSDSRASQESHGPSQPFVLQTQAPYSSQVTG